MPKTYIIEQDEHLENLSKIIKRDFFHAHAGAQPSHDTIPLSLNDYIKNFKSNENQIFTELVHADVEDWKKRNQWMEKSKQLMLEPEKKEHKPYTNMIKRDPVLKAIDFSVVKQDTKNAIFFSPSRETKSYNDPEHDKVKKVLYQNCRIESQQIEKAKVYEKVYRRNYDLEQVPQTPVLEGRHSAGNDPSEYSIRRAPSPEPEKIPIMTWGQIESTPLRIGDKPEYEMPQVSAREKVHSALLGKINKEKMIRKDRKDELKLKILSSSRVNSSYRKVSVVREGSHRREVKKQQN